MTERKPSVSRPHFDELIGRALEIQQRSDEHVDLERARAIALELGVSAEAWEQALEERRVAAAPNAVPNAVPPAAPRPFEKPLSIGVLSTISVRALAVTGASIGFASAMIARGVGGIEVPLGAAGLVVGTFLAIESARRDRPDWRLRIGAWWTSVTLGVMIGSGGVHPDPIVFGAAGWLLSEAAAAVMRRVGKR